jgi:hypothetical protein
MEKPLRVLVSEDSERIVTPGLVDAVDAPPG